MPKPPFKALIFDWDGTLANSTGHIVNAIQAACAEVGLPIPDDKSANHVIGLSLSTALHTFCPRANPDELQALVVAYQKHYLADADKTMLFPGVHQALADLDQRYLLTVATGKGRPGLDRALIDTDTAHFFVSTRTVNECASKPNPDMILSLCDELGLYPKDVLMIGDTTHDLLMAQNAGAAAVALSTGAHDVATLNTVPHLTLAHSFQDFVRWLNQYSVA
ncbi:MAG: HAD-IA family hydrolase [Neisseriaceae bacterium]|nr:HAD-IA family hydrolase [Neisseriaceae bacterium]